MRWAKEQLEIIGHRQGNLLVSAAAGAGKTTVLVERIVQIMLDEEKGTDLDRMLIVTFTNLAAGQMKERIFKRLSEEIQKYPEKERLKRQLALLPRCSIMTIHAFCLQTVKRYIAKLPQLDPGFRVGDENETALLTMDVLQEVIADAYVRYDENPETDGAGNFEAMVEEYGGTRQDVKLEPLLLRIYQFMQSMPEPWLWLEKAVEQYHGQELYGALCGIRSLLMDFHKAFREEKCGRGIVDYNDFEHYAQTVLLEDGVPTQAAQELRDQYDYIFIDEYQDSNEIQERILNSVARKDQAGQTCNVFMVGDVKQSIYGFRYAAPQLFMEKLAAYHEEDIPRKIFLQSNYRSRPEILDGVNSIFESLMRSECGGIEYSQEQALRAGRSFPEAEEDMEDFTPRLYSLYMEEKDSKTDKTELEAEWAAGKIEAMLREPMKYGVWDGEEYRPLQSGDIVILLRSAKEAGPIYQRALEARNIPASASTSNRFFDTQEIRMALNLLRIIDNARQDIPLEGVLHSPLFGFTSEELAMVRAQMDRSLTFYEALERYVQEGTDLLLSSRIEEFFRQLEQWRMWSESLSVYELLLKLYRMTGLYEYAGAMKGGARRRANLDLLLARSEEFEKGIYSGVFQFLRFIDRMKEKDQDYEEASEMQNEDAVKILTIHKSKGLEFPVVFLCGMGKQFQMRDSQGTVLLHPELGIGSRWLDPERMLEYETERSSQIRQEKARETLAEEMRILYVAMTRAKDRLIVSGMGPAEVDGTERTELYRLEPERIWKAKTPMDWIYDILTHKEDSRWRLEAEPLNPLQSRKTEEDVPEKAPQEERWSEEELNGKLLWKYPHGWRNDLPMLLSVSALKRPMEEKEEAQEIPWEVLLQPAAEEETVYRGTYGGTLFHEVMLRCNLRELASAQGRNEALHRLSMLSEEEQDTFPRKWLEILAASSLYGRMCRSERLLREESFMCGYTPEELHREVPHFLIPQGADEREMIVVQGVIDAAFMEDGAWVLVDYKTDRHFSEETLSMYRIQLRIYSRALARITGIPVKERILYQVRYGKEYYV